MDASRELRELLQEQQAQSRRLEQAITALEQTDIVRQQAELLRQVEELSAENARLQQEITNAREAARRLGEENRGLQAAWVEHVANRRGDVLQYTQQHHESLFGQEENLAVSRLAAFNQAMRERIGGLRAELERQSPQANELFAKLAAVEEETRGFMRQESMRISQEVAAARAAAAEGYDALAQAPIPPIPPPSQPVPPAYAPVTPKEPRESLEVRIGGRATVIAGVCFMLLAVVFGLRYTFEVVQSDVLKAGVAYLIGGLFLAAGEFMHRRWKSIFSTGLCAASIAIFFASTAISYFYLSILNIPMAIGICVAVTALALVQSMRYDAQLIAVFALIGGYLPMTAVDSSAVMVLSAMVYFLLLNLFVLLVALRKRWQPLKFFSLFAGMISVGYLLEMYDYKLLAGIPYILANFLLYTAIVLGYPVLRKAVLRVSDTVLLGFNTLFSCSYIFTLLYVSGYENLNGAVALGMCIIFFGLATWLRYALEQDAGARGLFYATSFAFWVLAVPLQFESELVGLFWLFEGVALYVFGVLAERKWYRRGGGAIAVLSILNFTPYLLNQLIDRAWWNTDDLLVWKYSAITLGLLVMMAVSLYKYYGNAAFWKTGEGTLTRVLKVVAMVNLWLFLLYFVRTELSSMLSGLEDYRWRLFWVGLLTVVVTLGLGVLYRSIVYLRDKSGLVLARLLYIAGLIFEITHNASRAPGSGVVWLLGLLLVIALACACIIAMYDLLRGWRASPEWVRMGTSLYALFLVVQMLMVQGRFGFRSMVVSIVLILWALGLILFGFIQKYGSMRSFGLGLSWLSIGKLILFDLSHLTGGQKVISYFVFAIVFFGIGYAYLHFTRKFISGKEQPQAVAGVAPAYGPVAAPQAGADVPQAGVEPPAEMPESEIREDSPEE